MKQSQRIVKNAVAGVIAGVVGGLVYLLTTVAIARNAHVSLAQFGEYQWVLTFGMIAQLVADSGLPRMMIREIAKDPACVAKITGASAGLIWAISLVVCGVVGVCDTRDRADVDAPQPNRSARLEPLHVAEARVERHLRLEQALFLADEENHDARDHEPREHEDPHPHLLRARHGP